jgi:hypothetical protein
VKSSPGKSANILTKAFLLSSASLVFRTLSGECCFTLAAWLSSEAVYVTEPGSSASFFQQGRDLFCERGLAISLALVRKDSSQDHRHQSDPADLLE